MGLYDSHKRRMSCGGCSTVGQVLKYNSDIIMEQTWDNDIQSKTCYIYDFFHDDQPELNKHMTYKNTTKKKIDAKFIISSYGSIDKDQVAYHIMFKPSEPIEFTEKDEMYYFETDYRKKYDITYPIGLYIDLPDEKNNYVKWLICDFEESNQFTKYVILPCDYRFQWISIENGKRVKRQMWGCTRSQSSYTSGIWQDRYVVSLDEVNKFLLPLNTISQSFGHIKEDGENQRVVLSAKTDNPLTFKVSKIENTKPIGIVKVTLKEDAFNNNTDYIEKDNDGNIIGMWADYKSSDFEPINPEESQERPNKQIICTLSSSSYSIKNAGSYKTITAIYKSDDEDISNNYSSIDKQYFFEINGEDVSEYMTYVIQGDKNILKIKFNNPNYIGNVLTIKCLTGDISGETQLEIL